LTLTDVAAALTSLLADPRRRLCVHDARRLPMLGIAATRAAHATTCAGPDEGAGDPAVAALEALSTWLDSDAAGGA